MLYAEDLILSYSLLRSLSRCTCRNNYIDSIPPSESPPLVTEHNFWHFANGYPCCQNPVALPPCCSADT